MTDAIKSLDKIPKDLKDGVTVEDFKYDEDYEIVRTTKNGKMKVSLVRKRYD